MSATLLSTQAQTFSAVTKDKMITKSFSSDDNIADETMSLSTDSCPTPVRDSRTDSCAQVSPADASEVTSQAPAPTLWSGEFAGALKKVASFLPLHDLQQMRNVNTATRAVVEEIAPLPMPELGTAAVFCYWCPENKDVPVETNPAARGAKWRMPKTPAPRMQWKCLNCGLLTTGQRQCGRCHTAQSRGACRIFVGQLRKERTAELLSHMLRMLLPGMPVLHIEAHTNGNNGRGKGCAWVYLHTPEDALAVLELNRRVFVDHDGSKSGKKSSFASVVPGEGYWVVAEHVKPHLDAVQQACTGSTTRPAVLPRQLLTVELPKTSMLNQYTPAASHCQYGQDQYGQPNQADQYQMQMMHHQMHQPGMYGHHQGGYGGYGHPGMDMSFHGMPCRSDYAPSVAPSMCGGDDWETASVAETTTTTLTAGGSRRNDPYAAQVIGFTAF